MNETRAALLVAGLEEEDRQTIARAANRFGCDLIRARTLREALRLMEDRVVSVIVCSRDLPDGDWRKLLDLSATWSSPPKVIVVCRLADNRLWSEVLNLGGFDLLAAPLEEREVSYVLDSACRGSYSEERGVTEKATSVPRL
jgi:DNA-binding response OmpR family regulator